MMKLAKIVLLIGLALSLLLGQLAGAALGDGESEGFEPPAPAEAPTAEELTEGYFSVVAGLETGTAGASLKAAAAAGEICRFAANHELYNPDAEALRENLRLAFEAMDREAQARFREGFDGLRALLDDCLEDYEANRALFEDAGAAETMDEVMYDPLNRLAWENLRDYTLTLANGADGGDTEDGTGEVEAMAHAVPAGQEKLFAASLREDCDRIVGEAIQQVQPDQAVRRALESATFGEGRLILVAAGKAAWEMAATAREVLGERIDAGIVITKHDYARGELPPLAVREAGHPVPDADSFSATEEALALTEDLRAEDTVLFLLSGGGSALFESPLISPEELQDITSQLLASGADITEMNTVRKRLSAVKGGRFARHCAPAQILSIVLSDIIGDPLDMIASGPAYPDSSTCADAKDIVRRYALTLSEQAMDCLEVETPKALDNVTTQVTGSVRELCAAAARTCEALGYRPILLTDRLACEAREAGRFLANIARSHAGDGEALAFIAGGETVVHVVGNGKGGRNQELALAACEDIAGLENVAIFSVGSDGTDGPTDAAGGYVDGQTLGLLASADLALDDALADNDAFHALQATGGLIYTGPTGTNVNDVAVALVRPRGQF